MAKTISVERAGFETKWTWSSDRREVNVDVFLDGECVMEWAYPRVPGHASIAANANFWAGQAVRQALAECTKQKDA